MNKNSQLNQNSTKQSQDETIKVPIDTTKTIQITNQETVLQVEKNNRQNEKSDQRINILQRSDSVNQAILQNLQNDISGSAAADEKYTLRQNIQNSMNQMKSSNSTQLKLEQDMFHYQEAYSPLNCQKMTDQQLMALNQHQSPHKIENQHMLAQMMSNEYKTSINQISQVQNKSQFKANGQSDGYQHQILIIQENNQQNNTCKLWQIIRFCAAFIFFIQQILQWINFIIIFNYNRNIGWVVLAANLVSPVIGLVFIFKQIKRYDYFLELFPRKRVGVIFVILSFFNLDFVYAQLYQSIFVSTSDYIKIFNQNNLRKKRLNLIFQNFISVIFSSLILFEIDQNLNLVASKILLAYIFFQVFDLAFHIEFLNTDFFDDIISFFFNIFDLCFKDEEDDDDDDDDEIASQDKYDNNEDQKQFTLFRQIPFTFCTFLQFLRDNIFFSISFYHNFLDLSLRALLIGIAFQQNLFEDYSALLIYEIVIYSIFIFLIYQL